MAVAEPPDSAPPRVQVIDLPSFPDNKTRYLRAQFRSCDYLGEGLAGVGTCSSRNQSDTRVPTLQSLEADLARGNRFSRVSQEAVIGAFGTIGRLSCAISRRSSTLINHYFKDKARTP